jgi:hypothetical protein
MEKKQSNNFEFEAIKAGHYAVICSAAAEVPSHPITFAYLLGHLHKVWSDLKRHVRCSSSTAIIVEEVPSIVLKLVVPTKPQGALIAVVDEDPAACESDSTLVAPVAPVSEKPDRIWTLEESAMAEAEAIARAAARLSKGAIDVAERLIEKAEGESLPLEEAMPVFTTSPVETVTRSTYARARGPEQLISFLGDERMLGGGHAIPNQLYSRATFALTKCRVASLGKNQGRYLLGNAEDSEWQRLISSSGAVVDQLEGEDASDEMLILRLAEATNQLVDVDVCIKERVTTKGRRLVPLNIRNRTAIVTALKERLELIDE